MSEAKSKFSELVRRALQEGPQHVTRHGKDCVVIVSREDFDRFEARIGRAVEGGDAVEGGYTVEDGYTATEYKDFKDWLFNAPFDFSKLDLTRK